MKKLILFFILSAAVFSAAKGQCLLSPSTQPIITSPSDFDGSTLSMYYPTGSDVVTVRLNILFPAPGTYVGKFDTITNSQCQSIVDSLNYYMSHIGTPNYPLPLPHVVQNFADTKIRFVINTILHPIVGPASYLDIYTYNFPLDPSGINIIIGLDPTPNGGSAAVPGNLVHIEHANNNQGPQLNNYWGNRLLMHEIGHALGLWHVDNDYENHDYTGSNPYGNVLTNYDVNDFWLTENNAQYSGSTASNNYMGYSYEHRNYLSPKQIGKIHYRLRTFPALMPTVASYGTTFADCDVDPNFDIDVTANQIWNSYQKIQGNITIESGVHLTITHLVNMPKNGKIIVKPGAKLSIMGGEISSRPCGSWKGIEVWGVGGPQTLDAYNMPLYNGMIELNSAVIANAETGILLGRTAANGTPVSASGGGIISSQNANYVNNKIAVRFLPFLPAGQNMDNIGVFKLDTFIVNEDYRIAAAPTDAIRLEQVRLVDILGCCFSDAKQCTSIGVHCQSASFNLKDHCNVFTPSGPCTGVQTQNKFQGFQYGVYISNIAGLDVPSLVDHAAFDQRDGFCGASSNKSLGGIYIVNNFGTQVVNCDFKASYRYPMATSPMVYGLYLDNCTGYVVENNHFSGLNDATHYRSAGIFVNNSGPGGNSIYNNQFTSEYLGLWTQNENYDPATGAGLVMNCNDFVSANSYNIGVQKLVTGANCLGCPPPTLNPGIALTQGVVSGATTDYVRNTYDASCFATAEKEYYIDTQEPFAVLSHGSFGSPANFQPVTQTNAGCSNADEITLVNGITAPNQRSSYCPSGNLPTFSMFVLNQNNSNYRNQIQALQNSYGKLDNGNTGSLLAAISDPGINNITLYNMLMVPDFLSDGVLSAYFTRSGVPHGNLKNVFQKNAPVSPLVWQTVQTIGLSQPEMDDWQNQQSQNNLSAKNDLESKLTVAYNNLHLSQNEKIRRFLTDTTGPVVDSVLAIYSLNELPNSQFKKADLLITAGRFSDAQAQISQLQTASVDNGHFCILLGHVLNIKMDPGYADTLRADSVAFNYFKNVASSNNALVEGYGKSLLHNVYGYMYEEIKLTPVQPANGDRKSQNNNGPADKKEVSLISGIRLYPNPASNKLNISMENEAPGTEIWMLDLTGRVLLKQQCANDTQIDLSGLQNGLYLVNLYKNGKLLSENKIVVIR